MCVLGCPHKGPHTKVLKATGMCPLPALKTRRLRSRRGRAELSPQTPREAHSCLFQPLRAPGSPGCVAMSIPCLPPSPRGFSSLSMSLLFCLSQELLSWDLGHPHPGRPHLRSCTSSHLHTNTLFPKKVPFTGSSGPGCGSNLGGGTIFKPYTPA